MSNFIIAENRYQQKIMLDPADLIGRGILKDGLYDRTGLYFIEQILAQLPSPIAFDIGANIGNHALRMSEYCGLVYLFEPQQDIVKHLEATRALNNIMNWKICNFGLSNEEKVLTLYKNFDGCNGETSFVENLKGQQFKTEESLVYIGDEIVTQYSIPRLDFIKIDVEGFEAKVIAGLANSIQKFKPIIFMEWDKEITKQQFQEYDLFTRLFKNYMIKAVTRNPNEATLFKKIASKFHRLYNKKIIRKRSILGKFIPQNNYRHIVFIPEEKIDVLNKL